MVHLQLTYQDAERVLALVSQREWLNKDTDLIELIFNAIQRAQLAEKQKLISWAKS